EPNVNYNASCLQMTTEANEVSSPSFEPVSSASEDEEDKMLRLEFEWKRLETLPENENPLIHGVLPYNF
ncbi:unnamed protein product, partial [Allacma fusca]